MKVIRDEQVPDLRDSLAGVHHPMFGIIRLEADDPASTRNHRLMRPARTRRVFAVVSASLVLVLGSVVVGEIFALREDVRLLDSRITAERDLLRHDLQAANLELAGMRKALARTNEQLPPDVPRLVARVRRSIFTVYASGVVGSGFVVDVEPPRGYGSAIITNRHVIEGDLGAGRREVRVGQGARRIPALIYSSDATADLALLFVGESFPAIPWASNEGRKPRPGDFALAIGSPYGIEGTATTGVLSKILPDLVATDAAVTFGNSGGPLLNKHGEVVGVNTLSAYGFFNVAVRIEVACSRILKCP